MSSKRSQRSSSRRSEDEDLKEAIRRKHRRRKFECLTDEELFNIAQKSRDQQKFRELMATILCHGLSRNGLRRAKSRQDVFLSIKAVMMYVQTLCVLLVSLVAMIVCNRIKETESVFYATQLFLEIILLFLCLFVVLFENSGVRYFFVLAFLGAFFLNIIQLSYYTLFNEVIIKCQRIHQNYNTLMCLAQHPPTSHHNTYVVVLLAMFHFISFFVAMVHQNFYFGTLSHLIELAKAVGFTACLTHLEERERRKFKKRRRKRMKSRNDFGTTVDVSKLPIGTEITAERNTVYKFKGNVLPGRVVVGSGQESVVDSVTVQAPNKDAAKRESKVVRHVMLDSVGSKQKREVVMPATKKQRLSDASRSSTSRCKPQKDKVLCTSRRSRHVKQRADEICFGGVQGSSLDTMKMPCTGRHSLPFNQRTDEICFGTVQSSSLDTIPVNSLREMKQVGSPRSYISSKSDSRRRKRVK